MRIVSIITDYIRASLLTTKGDIVKHNGVSAKKLAIGSPGQILTVNAAGDDLEYLDPAEILTFLTTKGDMIKHDGIGPARFPKGSLGQILRVDPATGNLVYQQSGVLLYQYTWSGSNVGVITLDPAGEPILTQNLGDVSGGDIFKIHGHVKVYNSGVGTGLHLDIFQDSGDATFAFLNNADALMYGGYIYQANSWYCNFNAILRIYEAGTFILGLSGVGGNQCTIAVGDAQIYTNLQQRVF